MSNKPMPDSTFASWKPSLAPATARWPVSTAGIKNWQPAGALVLVHPLAHPVVQRLELPHQDIEPRKGGPHTLP